MSLAIAALAYGSHARAQFDPNRVVQEPAAVAEHFPDPAVRYATPSLRPGRTDFASHAEVLAYLDELAASSKRLQVEIVGHSQQGRAIPLAVLTAAGHYDAALPSVLILAQQHGNEPASGEAALALLQQLVGPRSELLNRVNVLVLPRANADGADGFSRATRNGIDVNRDHLLLRTPEARAIALVTLKYRPQVVLDLHEFTVARRWVDKFGVMQKYDALVQPATVGNLDPQISMAAGTEYVQRLHRAWAEAGLSSFSYHTTSPDPKDKVVAMGGVQPDTGRNTAGLRPAISLLLEVRGVGIGRAHLLRRVHTAVIAGLTVVETAAQQGTDLVRLIQHAEASSAGLACHGEVVVSASQTSTKQQMVFVDAVTGTDKPLEVEWRAASPLKVERSRARPCGYLIAANQTDAVERLRMLGVRLHAVIKAARWHVEHYVVTSETTGQRQDARGAIDDGDAASLRVLEIRADAGHDVVSPDYWYVPLDQGAASLAIAALEPDSQNSFAANRLLEPGSARLLRVLTRPAPDWIERGTK